MYKVGDKGFVEVEIVLDGDEKSYCFPNIKSKVYECRIKGLTHKDNKLMYFSESQLIPNPIAKIQERLQFLKDVDEQCPEIKLSTDDAKIQELEMVLKWLGEE